MKDETITLIEPARGWRDLGLAELWRYRELFGFLVWRDIKVLYKQTALGASWAIIVPFLQMVVFSAIFGGLAGAPSDGLPKPVYYYAGLLPWTFFATALTRASNTLISNPNLLTKIYFPRMIVPLSPCIAGLVDFAMALSVLALMMAWYGLAPPLSLLLMPLLLAQAFVAAAGGGLLLAALNVRFRDIRFIVPFLTQIWMYCTVIMPFSSLPDWLGSWRYLYGLNPMAGVVEGFRWLLVHPYMSVTRDAVSTPVEAPIVLIALGAPVTLLLFVWGILQFKHLEDSFADIV